MTLPSSVAQLLLRYGLQAETLSGVEDLYRRLGQGVIAALGELAEELGRGPSEITRADLQRLRALVGRTYLDAAHEAWQTGRPTVGFWRDPTLGAEPAGAVTPLANLEQPEGAIARRVDRALRRLDERSPSRGVLCLSRRGHQGNYAAGFSVDLVPSELDYAHALNEAAGRQHTLPGSIGETSGHVDSEAGIALVWEIQPNLFKPSAERSPAARRPYRKYRFWPVATCVGALAWLVERDFRVYVLRGRALPATHEVINQPRLGEQIAAHYERTATRSAQALGLELVEAEASAAEELKPIAKLELGPLLDERPASEIVWRVTSPLSPIGGEGRGEGESR